MNKITKISIIGLLSLCVIVGGAGTSHAATTVAANAVTNDGVLTVTGALASTWSTSAGDLTVSAAGASLNLLGTEADAAAILLDATGDSAGGIDIDAGTGGVAIDTTGAFSVDGKGASNVTTDTGALTLATTTSGILSATSAGLLKLKGVGTGTTALLAGIGLNATGTSTIVIGGADQTGVINIADPASSAVSTINVGTSAKANVVTIGSSTGAAATTIDAGSVGVAIEAAAGPLALATTTSGILSATSAGLLKLKGVGTGTTALLAGIGLNATGTSTIVIGGADQTGVINIADPASSAVSTINVGTSAKANVVTIGSSTGAAATTIDAGSVGVAIEAAAGPLALATTTSGILSATSAGLLKLKGVGTGTTALLAGIGLNATGTSTIVIGGADQTGVINIADPASSAVSTINVGTSAKANVVTIGSSTGAAATTIDAGSVGVAIEAAAGPLALATTTSGILSATSAGLLKLKGVGTGTTALLAGIGLNATGTSTIVIGGADQTGVINIADPASSAVSTINVGTNAQANVITIGTATTTSSTTIYARRTPVTASASATPTLVAAESGSVNLFDRASGVAFVLPAPVAGMTFDFVVTVGQTSGTNSVTTDAGTTFINGGITMFSGDDVTPSSTLGPKMFACDGTTHLKVTMNATTTGGGVGTFLRFVAYDSTHWVVSGNVNSPSGTIATPCST